MSLTDPSGMFTCVSCVADESGNPLVIGAAAAIDIGAALGGLFGSIFGGGHPPPYANFPFPDQSQSAMPSGGPLGGQPWSERLPAGVRLGGGVNIGGVFGSGNTSPYVFSLQPGSQPTSVLDNISDLAAGAGDALTTIPFTSLSLTRWVRTHTPGGDPTNSNSEYYKAGQVTGTTLGVAITVAGGATAAAVADTKYGAYFGRGTVSVFNTGRVRVID